MLVSDNDCADKAKYAFTWDAKKDALLGGDKFSPFVEHMDAPPGRVFVVYISPNEMLEKYPDIWGWIEHWAWVSADPDLEGAPIDWKKRYEEKVWSRADQK